MGNADCDTRQILLRPGYADFVEQIYDIYGPFYSKVEFFGVIIYFFRHIPEFAVIAARVSNKVFTFRTRGVSEGVQRKEPVGAVGRL